MALKILQNKIEILQARQKLLAKRVSFIDLPVHCLLRKLKLKPGMAIGGRVKSWDVLSVIDFLDSHVQKNEPILDIGCYASETIVALHKLGYSNLTGVDLNSNLLKMPYRNFIHYEIGDFMHTKFDDGAFRAITSISVIEHGFNGPLLLKEVSRLLNKGGYFIATFDYWPEKIDTKGVKLFGLDWQIFSRDEIKDLIIKAGCYGLVPSGKMLYEAKDAPIDWQGKKYTFAWLALRKV
ncbi:MAG: class I SAM-dependent methyltransferase [Candidatus Omnitrophica bacterium]|jgi:SAM-dependent methyltransferase|nr:class I SAM-dependent methyltransferase [Candidatus Omnitrophota bacterium]